MSHTSFGETPTSNHDRRNTSAEQIGARVGELGYDWIKSDWHLQRIMARAKDLATDHTSSAIERGWILLWLRARWGLFRVEADYEKYDFGMNSRTGQRLTKLVLHERMGRDDWERPRSWYVCYLLLEVSDKLFEIMIGQNTWKGRNVGFIDRHTTQRQILDFKRMYQNHQFSHPPSFSESNNRHPDATFLNQIVCGDCLELIPRLTDKSISAVITSPPYAQQRGGKYEGISEEAYPAWFCSVMEALRPKLTVDGSVLVVIRSHLENGRVSQYVMRTRLAIQDAGWVECEELIWYKPDGSPLGSIKRPRRAWENILWYSTIEQPYVDLKACGKPSQRIGLESSNPHDNIDGTNIAIEGIARLNDVFVAAAGDVDGGVPHPAIYPPSLVSQLIRTFAPPGSVILDPFVGSGTTCLVAQSEDYDFIGFDSEQRYVDLANRRLKAEAKYFRGVSKLERERAKDLMVTKVSAPVTMPTSKSKAIFPWP